MAGAVSELGDVAGPFLVLDIGGGSTELVVGTGADDPELAAVSLQVGCVRLTERFLQGDPPTAEERADAVALVEGPARRGARGTPAVRRRPDAGGPGRNGAPRSPPSTWVSTSTTGTGSTTPC